MAIENEDQAADVRSEYQRPEYQSDDRDFNDVDYLCDCISIAVPPAITFEKAVEISAKLNKRMEGENLYAYDTDMHEDYDEHLLCTVAVSTDGWLVGVLDNETWLELTGLAIITSKKIVIHRVPEVKPWKGGNNGVN